MEDSAEDMTDPRGSIKLGRSTQKKNSQERLQDTTRTNAETEPPKFEKYELPLDTDILDSDRKLLRNIPPLNQRLR